MNSGMWYLWQTADSASSSALVYRVPYSDGWEMYTMAREHEVVHIAIGIEGPAPVLNSPGIQLAVGVRQADDLCP